MLAADIPRTLDEANQGDYEKKDQARRRPANRDVQEWSGEKGHGTPGLSRTLDTRGALADISVPDKEKEERGGEHQVESQEERSLRREEDERVRARWTKTLDAIAFAATTSMMTMPGRRIREDGDRWEGTYPWTAFSRDVPTVG